MTAGWDGPPDRAIDEEEDPIDVDEMKLSKADVFVETGLTPEEYVLAVIESNCGRVKQQTISDLTGWSDGTVSRILSSMEANGEITRIRIGREKVVFLPDSRADQFSRLGTDEES